MSQDLNGGKLNKQDSSKTSKSGKSGKSSKTSKTSKPRKTDKISNIEYPFKRTWDVLKTHVTFDVQKLPLSVINSIRRTIISDVKTFAAKATPYKQSTIEVIKNDSALTNQIIQHRISLIPINISDESFLVDDYEFIINVVNNDNKFREITTDDIQIKNLTDGSFLSKEKTLKFFPKDPLLNTDILITKLKPVYLNNNPAMFESNTNKLTFHLKFKIILSNGTENACFMPQSAISCSFKEDPKLVEKARDEYIKNETEKFKKKNLTPVSKDELTKIFDTSFKQRYFYKDVYGEPNYFEFLIESIGVIPPLIIFHRGCQELINRINSLEINLKSDNTNIITINPSKNILNGFELLVKNETDTLGNILQEQIFNKFSNNDNNDENIVSFISYKRSHPLEETILFNIASPKYKNIQDIISNIFVPSCQSLIRKIKSLQNDLEETPEYINELKKLK